MPTIHSPLPNTTHNNLSTNNIPNLRQYTQELPIHSPLPAYTPDNLSTNNIPNNFPAIDELNENIRIYNNQSLENLKLLDQTNSKYLFIDANLLSIHQRKEISNLENSLENQALDLEKSFLISLKNDLSNATPEVMNNMDSTLKKLRQENTERIQAMKNIHIQSTEEFHKYRAEQNSSVLNEMKLVHENELLEHIFLFLKSKQNNSNITHTPKVVPNYKVKQLKLCTCNTDRFTPYTMKLFKNNTLEHTFPLFECNNVHSGNGEYVCVNF